MNALFKLHPSRIFSALLFSVYSLAILIVLILPIADWARAALVVLLLCALVYYLRRNAWLSLPSSPVAIRIAGKDIALLGRDGSELTGQVWADSVVTPMLTILNILPQGKRNMRSVVIFPDSMDAERFRELRVLLKWSAH